MSPKTLIVFYLTVILAISSVSASTAECNYSKDSYENYSCFLKIHDQEDASDLTEISGNHRRGKNDEKVKAAWVHGIVLNPSIADFLCRKFPNLNRLFLSRLELSELPENTFVNCPNLKQLTLHSPVYVNPGIKSFHKNLIANNPKLEFFDAELFQLQQIPENFFVNNVNLKEVRLRENKISSLPANIFKPLVNLETLILSKNQLPALNPKWFSSLKKLENLLIENNNISEIPKGAFKPLRKLKDFTIAYNNLKTIHSDSFSQHPNLKNIDLRNNHIESIDERFIDNIGVESLIVLGNECVDEHLKIKDSSNSDIKNGLKLCFENYKPRADAA